MSSVESAHTGSRSQKASGVPRATLEVQGTVLAALYALTLSGFALAAAIPVIFGLSSQSATIPFRVVMLSLAIVVMSRWCMRPIAVFRGRVLIAIGVLWLALIARLVWDTLLNPGAAQFDRPVSQLLLLAFLSCFLGSLPFLEAPSRETLRHASRLVEIVGAIALVALAWSMLAQVRAGAVLERFATEVLNPISIGHLAVSVLIASVANMTELREAPSGRPSRLLDLVRPFTILLALGALVASASKGPMLALVVVVLLAIVRELLYGKKPGRALLWLLGMFCAVAALIFVVGALERGSGLVSLTWRFVDFLSDESTSERVKMFRGAFEQFAESPLLGSSLVEFQTRVYPHNILVESLMMTGLGGFLLLVIFLLAALASTWRLLVSMNGGGWVGLLFVQYVIASMLSGALVLDAQFWAFGFAALAAEARLNGSSIARAPLARDSVRS